MIAIDATRVIDSPLSQFGAALDGELSRREFPGVYTKSTLSTSRPSVQRPVAEHRQPLDPRVKAPVAGFYRSGSWSATKTQRDSTTTRSTDLSEPANHAAREQPVVRERLAPLCHDQPIGLLDCGKVVVAGRVPTHGYNELEHNGEGEVSNSKSITDRSAGLPLHGHRQTGAQIRPAGVPAPYANGDLLARHPHPMAWPGFNDLTPRVHDPGQPATEPPARRPGARPGTLTYALPRCGRTYTRSTPT